jgi:predicted enzyme related to lactoylglutathione lyase
MSHGVFAWNELVTQDVDEARNFYTRAIGWTIERLDGPFGTYWMVKNGDTPVAGMVDAAMSPVAAQSGWVPYLEVDDVDQRTKAVAANGGKVLREPFDAPGIGRIAIIADPTGAAIGWMTPKR